MQRLCAAARLLSTKAKEQAHVLKTKGEHVLVTKHEHGVYVITLNNPSKLNMMTVGLGEEFVENIQQLKDQEDLRAVILTGAGRAFSAGGDLEFLIARTKTDPITNSETMRRFYSRMLIIRTLPVPVIAAINGPAVGAGLCLAAACDIRVASSTAKMAWTFTSLGIHPGMAATHYTAQLLGPQLAYRYLLTGETLTGEEAARIGLVAEHVEEAQVLPKALELATKIATNSPVSVRTCVQTLRMKQDVGLELALAREADTQAHTYAMKDLQEGIAAVQQKRKPKF